MGPSQNRSENESDEWEKLGGFDPCGVVLVSQACLLRLYVIGVDCVLNKDNCSIVRETLDVR